MKQKRRGNKKRKRRENGKRKRRGSEKRKRKPTRKRERKNRNGPRWTRRKDKQNREREGKGETARTSEGAVSYAAATKRQWQKNARRKPHWETKVRIEGVAGVESTNKIVAFKARAH